MEVICTICNEHSNTMEKHERHMQTADHKIRASIYNNGMEAGEYKSQNKLAALTTERDELREAIVSMLNIFDREGTAPRENGGSFGSYICDKARAVLTKYEGKE